MSRPRKRFTVDALFTDTRPQAVGVEDLVNAKLIEIARIHADPAQPRRTFDPDRLQELAQSIEKEGVLQPIVVRFDAENDRYVIVHGERRWRAAKLASLPSIPALVRDIPPERRLLQQLMENVIREDLNAVDRAAALRTLREQLGEPSWEVVADTVGIKRSRLFQLLGTEKLTSSVQTDIREGRLSEKQSRALQGLSPVRQDVLRSFILEHGLSASDAMRLARAFRGIDLADETDRDAISRALTRAHRFVFAVDNEQLLAQTRSLLAATREAIPTSKTKSSELRSLASTLAAGKHTPERFGKSLNAIAKSLASLRMAGAVDDPVIAANLPALRETIDRLLGEES